MSLEVRGVRNGCVHLEVMQFIFMRTGETIKGANERKD